MSGRAAAYQSQIAGRAGESYLVNGVKFDGFEAGTLLELRFQLTKYLNWHDLKRWLASRRAFRVMLPNEGSGANGVLPRMGPNPFFFTGIGGIRLSEAGPRLKAGATMVPGCGACFYGARRQARKPLNGPDSALN